MTIHAAASMGVPRLDMSVDALRANGVPWVDVTHSNFKADPTGNSDSTDAIRAAIRSLPSVGGRVFFPGAFRLDGDLSTELNGKQTVILCGMNGSSSRGNAFPPLAANPSRLLVKNLTDYLFKKLGSTLQSLRFEGLDFDGSNGGGTAAGSTTCPGLVAGNGQQLYFFSCLNVSAHDFKYAHAPYVGPTGRAIFDLDIGVFSDFVGCYFAYVENGRIYYSGSGSTTFSARKCYHSACREAFYFRETTGASFADSVFESMVTIGASYLSNVKFDGKCHFENIGQNTGAAAWTTGLAPRDHGIGGAVLAALPGNTNTALNQMYGDMVVDGVLIQQFSAGSPLVAWIEAVGMASGVGDGGTLTVRNTQKRDATASQLLFAPTMAFGATARGNNFSVCLEDTFGASPVGAIINLADDARKVDRGRARIVMSDFSAVEAEIRNGRFFYRVPAFTGFPTVYPRNDGARAGDRYEFQYPGPAAPLGIVCYSGGTGSAGSWEGFGGVRGVNPDRGDTSVTLAVDTDVPTQIFATALSVNRTITLSTSSAKNGDEFRIVRQGLGAGTLDVGGLKTIPAATAATVLVVFNGTSWRLAGYSPH